MIINANVSRATFKRFNVSIFFAKLSTIIYLTNQAMIPESGITRWRQSKNVHRLPFFLSRPHTVLLIFLFALYPTWEPVHRLSQSVSTCVSCTNFKREMDCKQSSMGVMDESYHFSFKSFHSVTLTCLELRWFVGMCSRTSPCSLIACTSCASSIDLASSTPFKKVHTDVTS